MRIGVLADTHAQTLQVLSKQLLDELRSVDLILHAGDYTGTQLLTELRGLNRFQGVYGNMDPPVIRRELPAITTLNIEGFRIAVAHPAEGGPPFRLAQRTLQHFTQIHALIYGHTHHMASEQIGGILCLNPGSATGAFPAIRKSYALLEVGKELRGTLIKL